MSAAYAGRRRLARLYVEDGGPVRRSPVCSIEGCGKPVYARGWCSAHYTKWRRWGNPQASGTGRQHPKRRMPVLKRTPTFVGGDATHGSWWEIPLTRGFVALVSDRDPRAQLVLGDNWCATTTRSGVTYAGRNARVNGKKRLVLMHQVLGFHHADHLSGDGCDNRLENLRPATTSQNLANRFLDRSGKDSKYKGVTTNGSRKRPWQAGITVNGKRRLLGSFRYEWAAALAYDRAAVAAWGEFAAVNFKRRIAGRWLFDKCPRIPRP